MEYNVLWSIQRLLWKFKKFVYQNDLRFGLDVRDNYLNRTDARNIMPVFVLAQFIVSLINYRLRLRSKYFGLVSSSVASLRSVIS